MQYLFLNILIIPETNKQISDVSIISVAITQINGQQPTRPQQSSITSYDLMKRLTNKQYIFGQEPCTVIRVSIAYHQIWVLLKLIIFVDIEISVVLPRIRTRHSAVIGKAIENWDSVFPRNFNLQNIFFPSFIIIYCLFFINSINYYLSKKP